MLFGVIAILMRAGLSLFAVAALVLITMVLSLTLRDMRRSLAVELVMIWQAGLRGLPFALYESRS